jgi:hypothetical protein
MKGILKKISLFSVLLFSAILCFYGFNQYLFKKYVPVVDQDKSILAMGMSFSQFALNDSLIPGFENASMKGRTGLGIYLSIRKMTEANPHVRAVLVDFSPLHTLIYRDYKFFLPIFAPSEFHSIYPLANLQDLRAYPLNYKEYFINQVREEWVPNWTYLRKALGLDSVDSPDNWPYRGSFSPQDGVHLDGLEEWINRLERMQAYAGDSAVFSNIDLTYMDSLVHFCQKNELELFVFCAPIHEELTGLLPPHYFTSYNEKKAWLQGAEEVRLLEFDTLRIEDDYFYNHSHLNRQGSDWISPMVAAEIQRCLKDG